eukprot:4245072-Prymnesium_polylepis.2
MRKPNPARAGEIAVSIAEQGRRPRRRGLHHGLRSCASNKGLGLGLGLNRVLRWTVCFDDSRRDRLTELPQKAGPTKHATAEHGSPNPDCMLSSGPVNVPLSGLTLVK